MNNAELFESIFGLKATELWAFSEKQFLAWYKDEAPTFRLVYRSPTNAEILENYYKSICEDEVTK